MHAAMHALGPSGELIPLDEQDRTRWHKTMIDEGVATVSSALRAGQVGPYQLQAAIAALHDEAPRVEDTDCHRSQRSTHC